MLHFMLSTCVQVLSKHDEQQRRLQLVISFHLAPKLLSRNVTQPLTSLTQLKDEVRSIERRLREAQAAVAEQEAAMRVDEGEKHRAEQRRQECSRQWAKDDEKLCALQRSVQANDANRRKLFAVNVTLCQPYRPSLSLRRILRDCSCRSKLPRSQARVFFAVFARFSQFWRVFRSLITGPKPRRTRREC